MLEVVELTSGLGLGSGNSGSMFMPEVEATDGAKVGGTCCEIPATDAPAFSIWPFLVMIEQDTTAAMAMNATVPTHGRPPTRIRWAL